MQLKDVLHGEIDYTINATIIQYKQKNYTLTKEQQKLYDTLDAVGQHNRRDLLPINRMFDGGKDDN